MKNSSNQGLCNFFSYFYTPGHYDILQIDPRILAHLLSLEEQEDPFMGLRPLISN